MRRRRAAALQVLPVVLPVVLLAVVAVARPVVAAAPRSAAEQSPTVTVSPSTASVGAPVTVALAGWPAGVVTVSICGDGGRRGSVDCDQIGSHGAAISASGSASVRLTVSPPLSCPCVVRVSSPTSDLVRTAPLDVPGFPRMADDELLPALMPPTTTGSLEVTARLEQPRTGPTSLSAAFGGPVGHILVLTVSNHGSSAAIGVTVSAAVGRDRRSGSPVMVPPVDDLAPGEQRTLSVPVTLPAFASGRYLVFGRVDSMVGGARFEVATSTVPWATWLLVALSVVVMVRVIVRRRRSTRAPSPAAHVPTSTGGPSTEATMVLLDELAAIDDSWLASLSSDVDVTVDGAHDRGRSLAARR